MFSRKGNTRYQETTALDSRLGGNDEGSSFLEISLDPARIYNVKPRSRRTHCQAIINWHTRYNQAQEARSLEASLGMLYQATGKAPTALAYFDRAITLATALGMPPAAECLERRSQLQG